MKNWLLGSAYLVIVVGAILSVVSIFAYIATTDPYADEDQGRGVVCERSGGKAPECKLL